ncbi:hypothetical protein N7492_008646, partial [Penicillium capsulatum]
MYWEEEKGEGEGWLKDDCHLIVPGEPPAWTPPTHTRKLHPDSGEYVKDQDASRYPEYPLEPIIQVVLVEQPDFAFQDRDIVGCGHSLSHLLGFLCGDDKSFRVLVGTVGKTVFLIRRENSPAETIQGVRGYGHTFPEAYTTWGPDVKRSASHQRIMNYEFAGMKILVRFGSDGYLPGRVPADENSERQQPPKEDTGTVEPTDTEAKAKTLRVEKGGRDIPQCAVFDIRTRSARYEDPNILETMLFRLWISQIPNFILAHHTFGVFDGIRILDVREKVQEWEETNQALLSKFGLLLKKIISFAQASELGRFEVFHKEGESSLELRAQTGNVSRALPADVAARWTSKEDHTSPTWIPRPGRRVQSLRDWESCGMFLEGSAM